MKILLKTNDFTIQDSENDFKNDLSFGPVCSVSQLDYIVIIQFRNK